MPACPHTNTQLIIKVKLVIYYLNKWQKGKSNIYKKYKHVEQNCSKCKKLLNKEDQHVYTWRLPPLVKNTIVLFFGILKRLDMNECNAHKICKNWGVHLQHMYKIWYSRTNRSKCKIVLKSYIKCWTHFGI